MKPKSNNCEVYFKQWFSEEGGRLKHKRNLGIIINNLSKNELEIENDFKWITLKQIKQLILENALKSPAWWDPPLL